MSHSSPPSGCPFHAAQNRAPATGNARPADGTPAAGAVPDAAAVLAATRIWVEKAVVGLNLCPFANAVLKKERLHIQVSEATEPLALLEDLRTELKRLLDAPETEIETSLLVCPRMLADFLEFNDFLDMAEALLTELDLHGTVQIASFHPHYQFAGTAVDDIENATNQSPWPTLHLLRETSIDRAVAAWGEDTDACSETTTAPRRGRGPEGWRRLGRQWRESASESPDEKPPSVG